MDPKHKSWLELQGCILELRFRFMFQLCCGSPMETLFDFWLEKESRMQLFKYYATCLTLRNPNVYHFKL